MRSLGLLASALLLSLPAAAGPATLHPRIRLLDASGRSVLERGGPLSTARSCSGARCHDGDYIAGHTAHPAPPGATEVNCLACHLQAPDDAGRRAASPAWQATATLGGTGVVVRDTDAWRWVRAAFADDGTVDPAQLGLGPPTSAACGHCHGLVHEGPEPLRLSWGPGMRELRRTGRVYSAQSLRRSALNLVGKEALGRPWDVHAARLLGCVDCHVSPSSPAHPVDTTAPRHLRGTPRHRTTSEHLRRPDHRLAARDCRDCHDATAAHPRMPYRALHLARLACGACHIPWVHAPSRATEDWLRPSGEGPRVTHRGVEGATGDPRSAIGGHAPVWLPVADADGRTRLAPHTAIARWRWTDGPGGPPVDLERVHAAPGVRRSVVAARLRSLGVVDPRITGELEVIRLRHGVVGGAAAISDCRTCHTPGGRIGRPFRLAERLPGGVVPRWDGPGWLARRETGLWLVPEPLPGAHVVGLDRRAWVDRAGLALLALALGGAFVHGAARGLAALRRRS